MQQALVDGILFLRVRHRESVVGSRMAVLLLSPAGPVVFNAAILLLALALPDSFYFEVLGESKLVDMQTFAWVALCLASFWIGYLLLSKPGAKPACTVEDPQRARLIGAFFFVYGLVVILVNLFVVWRFYRLTGAWNPLASLFEFNSIADLYSVYVASFSGLSWITQQGYLIAIGLLWARSRVTERHARALYYVFLLLAVISTYRTSLRGDRGEMAVFWVSVIVYLSYAHRDKIWKVLRSWFALALVGVLMFAGVQMARVVSQYGDSATGELQAFTIEQASGYYLGSYNRLGYILNDNYIGSTNGYYTTRGLWKFPIMNELLPLQSWAERFFDYRDIYSSGDSFYITALAGLNPYYNVLTCFGYAFTDFGYFGVIVFLLLGMVAKKLYVSFTSDRLYGALMYPFFWWGMVEWRGFPFFAQYSFSTSILFIAVLSVFLIVLHAGGKEGRRVSR